MSTVVYVHAAITKPHTFTPGTPISAAEVNANFDALYTAVNDLQGGSSTGGGAGAILELTSSIAINCDNSSTRVPFSFDIDLRNSGWYDTSLDRITIPTTDYYNIRVGHTLNDYSIDFIINGGSAQNMSNNTVVTQKLTAGTIITFQHGCYYESIKSKGNPTVSITPASLYLTVIPI